MFGRRKRQATQSIAFRLGAEKLERGYSFAFELERELSASRVLRKALDGAPVASFCLARARALYVGIPAELPESYEYDAFTIELVASAGDAVVASFRLEGGMALVEIAGRAVDKKTAKLVHEAFVAELLASPNELAPCICRTADEEWYADPSAFVPEPDDNTLNEYGWLDGDYLGRDNVCRR